MLKPSQQAELDNRSHELVVRQVDVTFYTSWVSGKIYFKDERLEDIMNTLSRWYDEIAPFLELLNATGRVKAKVQGREIKIY